MNADQSGNLSGLLARLDTPTGQTAFPTVDRFQNQKLGKSRCCDTGLAHTVELPGSAPVANQHVHKYSNKHAGRNNPTNEIESLSPAPDCQYSCGCCWAEDQASIEQFARGKKQIKQIG